MNNFTNGADRILFIKLDGVYAPIGCLSDNSFDETSEFIDTTTRDSNGWTTSRPVMQSYGISFNGLQVNSTVSGGNFNIASYDKLKLLKRDKRLLDWKIEGTIYPIVDYGKGYISDLSETNVIDEFLSFSGSIVGFGKPLTATAGTTVLNTGDIEEILNSGDPNEMIKIEDI